MSECFRRQKSWSIERKNTRATAFEKNLLLCWRSHLRPRVTLSWGHNGANNNRKKCPRYLTSRNGYEEVWMLNTGLIPLLPLTSFEQLKKILKLNKYSKFNIQHSNFDMIKLADNMPQFSWNCLGIKPKMRLLKIFGSSMGYKPVKATRYTNPSEVLLLPPPLKSKCCLLLKSSL